MSNTVNISMNCGDDDPEIVGVPYLPGGDDLPFPEIVSGHPEPPVGSVVLIREADESERAALRTGSGWIESDRWVLAEFDEWWVPGMRMFGIIEGDGS